MDIFNIEDSNIKSSMKILYIAICMLTIIGDISGQEVIPLYNGPIPNDNGSSSPTIIAYLPALEKRNGASVIIFPGGSYSWLNFKKEGTNEAEEFNEEGIAAFVVKYRLPDGSVMKDKSIGPLQDAQQAIKFVRMHAQSWHLDTAKVGVIGYSAGGHLASTLGTHYATNYIPNPENTNLRPDFMILVYPVISMKENLTHHGSRNSLLGENPSPELVKKFSNEEQVTPQTPPTYLTHTGDDSVVTVNNSIVFYQALQRNGVSAEMHLLAKGNHGFIVWLPKKEWMNPMLLWMTKNHWIGDESK